ncbi:HPr family phosphocarrier protein [Candidatus Woesearchaeota archaeon]|nr:HPr family phosphocarrier protein [Candidatus Woesearchaeota archaeon]
MIYVNRAFVGNSIVSLDDISDEAIQDAIKKARETTRESEGGLTHLIHDVDREMLGTYAAKLHWAFHPEKHPELVLRRRLPFDTQETFRPDKEKSPVKAEIILGTIARVFDPEHLLYGSHLEKNYDASAEQGQAALDLLGEVVSETNKLWRQIGRYEAGRYGKDTEKAFREIMKHLCTWDIIKHVENINEDALLSGKGFEEFREVIIKVVGDIRYAISNGQPNVPYLQHAFSTMDEFMEEYVRAQLGDSDAVREEKVESVYQARRDLARSRAEAFVVDMELLRTVFNRYFEFRCVHPTKYKQDGYVCADIRVTKEGGVDEVAAKAFRDAVSQHKSEVRVKVNGRDPVDGNNVPDVVKLDIKPGSVVTVMASGSDAVDAVNYLGMVVRTGFRQSFIYTKHL